MGGRKKMVQISEYISNHHGLDIHLIPTKKFKTVSIVVKCKAPLDRKTVTSRALLSYILQQGTEKYPSEQQLTLKLDELYGAVFYIDCAKKGNDHIISFRLEIANEKYIKNESTIIYEGLQLLGEIIFQPNVIEQAFPEKIVRREKTILKNKIESIVDDKIAYANMRLIDEMCENERFSVHTYGYVEDLDAIDGKSLHDAYNKMINHDQFDLYVIGDFDKKEMEDKIISAFQHAKLPEYHPVVNDEGKTIKKINEITEFQPIQQAKLHIGYRTNCTYKDEDYAALHIFNAIFGGFPSSKLFMNVREKNSLAYYASSRLESHKGLLLVFSGIEGSNYTKAREIIDLQMEEMKKGQFTEADIKSNKELVISQIKETLDTAQGMLELHYQQVVANYKLPPNELIEKIQKVTQEDILRVANKIELDTVYLLTNEGVETNE